MILKYAQSQIANLSLLAHKKYKSELDMTLELPNYINFLLNNAFNTDPKFQGKNTLYKKPYPRTIRIAPSIKEISDSIDTIKDKLDKVDLEDIPATEKYYKKQDMIRSVVKPKQIITLDKPLPFWWGDTLKAINIRPGFINNDKTKCYPFQQGGNKAHFGFVGDTGQGKSVLLHAMIHPLLIEYPPWELQIYANDGKMQEFARYADSYRCPHFKNIAITSSSTYLNSVYKFFREEMVLMNNLFAMIPTNSIAGLRNYLDLVIPSNIVIHDEFAQFKANASKREAMEADDHLQAVSKLGRSTHYHLMLDSQELQGHVEASTLAQFTIGAAVGTSETNSEAMIGNPRAVDLKTKIGYAIVNDNRVQPKNEKDNKEYKVAFLDDDTDEKKMAFQLLLKRVVDLAESVGINDKPSVYNEFTKALYTELPEHYTLACKRASAQPLLEGMSRCATLALGLGTRYTGESIVLELMNWDFERRGNIYINAIDIADMQYIAQLVGDNLRLAKVEATHKMFVDNMALYSPTYINNAERDLTGEVDIVAINKVIQDRVLILKFNKAMKEKNLPPDLTNFFNFIKNRKDNPELVKFRSAMGDLASLDYDKIYDAFMHNYENIPEDDSKLQWCKKNDSAVREYLQTVRFFRSTMTYAKNTYLISSDFPLRIYWFLEPELNQGLVKKGIIKPEFLTFLESAPEAGIISIIMQQDARDMKPMISACKHALTGHPTVDLERMGIVEFTDTSGITCKYTVINGDGSLDCYFKKYLKLKES